MLIIANWKAYIEDLSGAKKLLAIAKKYVSPRLRIVLAPPTPLLGALSYGNRSKVEFASQDAPLTPSGAHTGEITTRTLKSVGAVYTIIGHSERRAAGETNALVAMKVLHALANDLIPIVCVGEGERDGQGMYLSVVREQLTTALSSLSAKDRAGVVIAYEPVWAIGKTASEAIEPHDLSEMVLYIRKVLSEFLPHKSGLTTAVVYGGSVEPNNAKALGQASGIDGFLVGHASADSTAFAALLKNLS